MIHDYIEIVKGNRALKRIIRNRKQKRDFAVFVFPDNDTELIDCTFRYLDAYCNYNGTKELFIIKTNDVCLSGAELLLKSKCDIRKLTVDGKQMNSILHFSAIFSFYYLCVISLDKPYGRNSSILLGYKGWSLDDFVCRDLFRLKSIPVECDAS